MSRPTPSFYNLAWRWHFYAGLFVAPFMILLALTGIIYLFKPQLDPLLYDHLLTVTPTHHGLSADEQLSRVQTAYPQGHISQYLPPINPQDDRAMICGSPSMLDETSAVLDSFGLTISPRMGQPGDYLIERAFVEK